MNKIRVIDLLNKIANGEEVPNKIYCFNREFYLKEKTYFGDTFTLMHYIQEEDLNDEVEIIEEDKKIEKLYGLATTREKTEIIPNNEELMFKINELIDEVNKLKENK